MINAITILSLSARAYSSTASSSTSHTGSHTEPAKAQTEQRVENSLSNNTVNNTDKAVWINNFKATQALHASQNFDAAKLYKPY